MITRVYGSINGVDIEFERIPDRQDYWEGIGPRVDGRQFYEIWAENDRGAKAYVANSASMKVVSPDKIVLLFSPIRAYLLNDERRWLQNGLGKRVV